MPTATGCMVTAFTLRSSSSRPIVLNPNMALSAVFSSSSEKHSIAWVVNWLAGMLLPFRNRFHLVIKLVHWAGEQPKSIVGWTNGGGFTLFSLAPFGSWSGWVMATWLTNVAIEAAASPAAVVSKPQPAM